MNSKEYVNQLFSLEGHVGIVTGASRGIGMGIAKVLTDAGAKIYNLDREKRGQDEEITGRMEDICVDLTDREETQEIVQRIAEEEGQLDFLVNNAGMTYKCLAQDFPSQMYQKIQKLNLETMFELCQICYHYITEPNYKNHINLKIQSPKGSFYIHKNRRKGVKEMETIRINQSDKVYVIKSIQPVAEHVIRIVFADEIPEKYGDIRVYTAGGFQCANLPGYSTVYRVEGKAVYLSDDGSVYLPSEGPGEYLSPEPYIPTLSELRAAKKAEVAVACEQAIYKGISVTLGGGNTEHFSLTEHDQINLFGKQAQLAAGMEQLEYHADGQPCRYYSASDMQSIIQAAMFHVSYHTTYCNALNMWLAGCQSAEEVETIFYGADVPEEYRSEVLDAYLLQIVAMAEESGDDTTS